MGVLGLVTVWILVPWLERRSAPTENTTDAP
jgi:hypothetical protein